MTVEILQFIGFDAAIGIVNIPFPPSGGNTTKCRQGLSLDVPPLLLYCIVLYCIVLYCIVMFCIVL